MAPEKLKRNPAEFLDPVQRRAAERRYKKWMVLGAGIPLVILLITVLATSTLAPNPHVDPGLLLLLTVLPMMVVFAVVLGLFWLLRRRGVWWTQASPILAFGRQDRRRLMRALRRDDPLPEDLEQNVVHAALYRLVRQGRYITFGLPVFLLVMIGLNVFNQLHQSQPDTFMLYYFGLLAVFLVFAQVRNTRMVNNARRKLARNEPL